MENKENIEEFMYDLEVEDTILEIEAILEKKLTYDEKSFCETLLNLNLYERKEFFKNLKSDNYVEIKFLVGGVLIYVRKYSVEINKINTEMQLHEYKSKFIEFIEKIGKNNLNDIFEYYGNE